MCAGFFISEGPTMSVHPRDALFDAGEPAGMLLPVCDHYAGVEARMRKDQNGATMIEYSILIGIITAAVVASVVIMGGRVAVWWTTLTAATAG